MPPATRYECSVCLSSLSSPSGRFRRCRHGFHVVCLRDLVMETEAQKRRARQQLATIRCPTCQKPIVDEDLDVVDLILYGHGRPLNPLQKIERELLKKHALLADSYSGSSSSSSSSDSD